MVGWSRFGNEPKTGWTDITGTGGDEDSHLLARCREPLRVHIVLNSVCCILIVQYALMETTGVAICTLGSYIL